MEVRVLPIELLKPSPYNPRRTLKPGDKAYRKLEASLREFGLIEPLVWNETTGHVVGGHARLSILRAMGVAEVTVSVVHLSDAREKALNVVLNNQEAQGRYDPSRLSDLLEELEELPELEMTGFDRSALSALRLEKVDDPLPEPDPTKVSVTLEMSPESFDRARSRIDALVREFDLVSHVTQA